VFIALQATKANLGKIILLLQQFDKVANILEIVSI